MSGRLVVEPGAPFRLDLTAWALRRRAHNAIDRFEDGVYRRVLAVDGGAVALAVVQEGPPHAPRLAVEAAGTPSGAGERLVRPAVERLLGVRVDMSGFAALADHDPLPDDLVPRMRGFRPPRFPTVFEALVNAVACQQLSLAVGIHLLNRLVAAYGRPVAGGGGRAFPGPAELAGVAPERLRPLGFSLTKARTVVEIARAIADGRLDLEGLDAAPNDEALARLTALRGIGRWSGEYVLLRGLGRLDVFPADDVGARNNLRRALGIDGPLDYAGVNAIVARWRPYAGLVYLHLLLDALARAGHVRT